MLTIKNLSFSFQKRKILDDLSLTIEKGEIIALIGSSGSGKTTLLRLICGMLAPQEGSIDTTSHSHAYMSQQDLLLPWRTVRENIILPLELEAIAHDSTKIDELMSKLEIESLSHRYPAELSGGQYKRAMLARALAPQKEILLLDEAFSSLDLPLRDKIYARLSEINHATTLLVTHDFRDAFTLSNRIVLLDKGKIGQEWHLDPEKKEDPVYIGTLFTELKAALARSASS